MYATTNTIAVTGQTSSARSFIILVLIAGPSVILALSEIRHLFLAARTTINSFVEYFVLDLALM
jgi:hypothetical protein